MLVGKSLSASQMGQFGVLYIFNTSHYFLNFKNVKVLPEGCPVTQFEVITFSILRMLKFSLKGVQSLNLNVQVLPEGCPVITFSISRMLKFSPKGVQSLNLNVKVLPEGCPAITFSISRMLKFSPKGVLSLLSQFPEC